MAAACLARNRNMPCGSLYLAAHGRYAQKLMTDLFSNYTNALRPVEDTDHIINVTLQITLSQIIDMDERNQILTTYLWIRQVWMDAYLTWKKEDYDGLDTIRIPSSYVWRPDIVLYNSADDEFSSSMETNVVLRNDGQVMWDQPAITKSSCSVDVAFFPFDVQECHLTFGSWTHNGNQMDLSNALDSADLADFVPNVEWEVLGMPAKKNVILYGCCSDPYPDITFTLHLKRRASFYIFNLLIPCMMISFLAPLGFYLPADSGEKVSLGVTVLLALTVFQLLVAESMPPSESVPLIGKKKKIQQFLASQFRQSAQQEASNKNSKLKFATSEEISCDICIETKLKALKSYLVCLASYCETHLEPHFTVTDHKTHDVVTLKEEYEEKKAELGKTEGEIQQIHLLVSKRDD
ncbi:hypothetical protein L3Q82_022594 [Scortum barcoo]|uniref:Uncharacterized protein n=1 Tax=Scortum barcoo TaxID=214431 RepID=A0ACB8X2R8_9TELE|nr:hypothetical protein L3Q82_022594 [Scortum barcoo]